MNSMIAYIDGSDLNTRTKGGNSVVLGYGIVTLHQDQHNEHYGRIVTTPSMAGYHELLSFIQLVQLATALAVAPTQLVVYTDDETVSTASLVLHPENYMETKAMKLAQRVDHALRVLKLGVTHCQVMQYLAHTRCHKLKGHRFSVYNNRVDYLAKHCAQQKEILDFDTWLNQGIHYYSTPDTPEIWQPPFTEPVSLAA